jgi:hypothetical protein
MLNTANSQPQLNLGIWGQWVAHLLLPLAVGKSSQHEVRMKYRLAAAAVAGTYDLQHANAPLSHVPAPV